MELTHRQSSETPKADEQPKQPYEAPRLIVHGTVETITGDLGVSVSDGITAS